MFRSFSICCVLFVCGGIVRGSLAFGCSYSKKGLSLLAEATTTATTSNTLPFLTFYPQSHELRGGWSSMYSAAISAEGVVAAEAAAANDDDDDDDDENHVEKVLSLSSIRSTLIRQEETIIFALIERAQFCSNHIVYEKKGFGNLGMPDGVVANDDTALSELDNLSFLEYMLLSMEILHNKVRRYTSPEEHPFFPSYLPNGPMSNLRKLDFPTDLLSSVGGASDLNFNSILLRRYIDEIIPSITTHGDDEQHGSSVVNDVTLLQALSRRIHYGKFVAESKYRSDPEEYQALVDANDDVGVMELLTNASVEEKLLRRVRVKAAFYGNEPMDVFVNEKIIDEAKNSDNNEAQKRMVAVAAASAVMVALESWERSRQGTSSKNSESDNKVDPAVIAAIYRDLVIPLTKDVEVVYLFRRCGKEPPKKYLGQL